MPSPRPPHPGHALPPTHVSAWHMHQSRWRRRRRAAPGHGAVCDLVDSTRLAGHWTRKTCAEVVRAYQETCAAVIAPVRGQYRQVPGRWDAGLFWLSPGPRRRSPAGGPDRVGISQALAPANTRPDAARGERLAVRLGIHTGLVVTGELGKAPAPGELGRGNPQSGGASPRAGGVQYGGDQCRDLAVVGWVFACGALGPQGLQRGGDSAPGRSTG